MSGKTNAVSVIDRRTSRRAASRAEIIDAAWQLVREQGLAGLSMRDLGERVGMRAQSVYSYFDSKDDIYDAMFRQGYEELLAWMADDEGTATDSGDPAGRVRLMAHRFFAFCTSDPVRYQLLFQRTIPGFQPSAASYAVALAALEQMHAGFARAGITDPDAADLATAVLTGLTSQQLSNDPGGTRWERLVDRAVTMLLREIAPHLPAKPTTRARRTR
ncbi:MAG: TetR/AcrR family transcriptional regulator [Candidatus Nanopelagicales bacterium]